MSDLKTIDDIILQYSTRGMTDLRKETEVDKFDDATTAVLSLKKGVIFLYTGFWVAGFAETDGPVGTYFLALALEKIGFKPVIVTDIYCKDFFKEVKTLYVPIEIKKEDYFQDILKEYSPVCHISIERCGRGEDGCFRNHRGDDISSYTAKLDTLFELGSKEALSISVGDGGNEIGMGKYKDTLGKMGINYAVTPSRYSLIASVSNWGAYGIIASLQKILHVKLLPAFEEVDDYLEYIVKLGSIDGISKKNIKSVDGKEWSLDEKILTQLQNI